MSENRLSTFAGRAEPSRTQRPSFEWPTYLVSAPHVVWGDADAEYLRVPYGEWHAREPGSLQTACGRPAVNWHFFWTLHFASAGRRACPECVGAVVRRYTRDTGSNG